MALSHCVCVTGYRVTVSSKCVSESLDAQGSSIVDSSQAATDGKPTDAQPLVWYAATGEACMLQNSMTSWMWYHIGRNPNAMVFTSK